MTDLISRLQSATSPSREMDAEIAFEYGWKHIAIKGGALGPHWRNPAGQICPQPPRYTESIDVVLTLVSIDMLWRLGHRADELPGSFDAVIMPPYGRTVVASHTFPAIALLIAIMQAKEDSKS